MRRGQKVKLFADSRFERIEIAVRQVKPKSPLVPQANVFPGKRARAVRRKIVPAEYG